MDFFFMWSFVYFSSSSAWGFQLPGIKQMEWKKEIKLIENEPTEWQAAMRFPQIQLKTTLIWTASCTPWGDPTDWTKKPLRQMVMERPRCSENGEMRGGDATVIPLSVEFKRKRNIPGLSSPGSPFRHLRSQGRMSVPLRRRDLYLVICRHWRNSAD